MDSQQAETPIESGDFCVANKGDCSELLPSFPESELPFLDDEMEETV